jgi:hypothetical protein
MGGNSIDQDTFSKLSTKERVFLWLFQQGTPVVLLTAILIAIGYWAHIGIPALVDKQTQELKQTREDFKGVIQELRADQKETRKEFLDALRDLKEAGFRAEAFSETDQVTRTN